MAQWTIYPLNYLISDYCKRHDHPEMTLVLNTIAGRYTKETKHLLSIYHVLETFDILSLSYFTFEAMRWSSLSFFIDKGTKAHRGRAIQPGSQAGEGWSVLGASNADALFSIYILLFFLTIKVRLNHSRELKTNKQKKPLKHKIKTFHKFVI